MNNEQPWLDEPNVAKWTDQATGLQCVIKRTMYGSLCGYVRLPHGSLKDRITANMRQRSGYNMLGGKVWRKAGYDHSALRGVDVHGGLTYCDKLGRPTGGTYRGVWVGFDCAHYGDCVPSMAGFMNGTYRDFAYVRSECESLAAQVLAAQLKAAK